MRNSIWLLFLTAASFLLGYVVGASTEFNKCNDRLVELARYQHEQLEKANEMVKKLGKSN